MTSQRVDYGSLEGLRATPATQYLLARYEDHWTLVLVAPKDAGQSVRGDVPGGRQLVAMHLTDRDPNACLALPPGGALAERAVGYLAQGALFVADGFREDVEKHCSKPADPAVDKNHPVWALGTLAGSVGNRSGDGGRTNLHGVELLRRIEGRHSAKGSRVGIA
jgi:hypothetical protein